MADRMPRYIDPADYARFGNAELAPPFHFREVTVRVFPLSANMARLTQFCDAYLNADVPDHIAHYRPALPYVYLMVLNYGNMSPASVQAQNAGWVAQHEVTFTVPLQRWRRDASGRLVFVDWANVSPFIFVDDLLSQATGREVYGWAKTMARVEATASSWAAHPRAAQRLFSLSTPMFRQAFAGEEERPQLLLEIDAAPGAAFVELPPDLDNPWSPLSAIPAALRNMVSLAGRAADALVGLPVRGFAADRNLRALLSMGDRTAAYLATALPDPLGLLRGHATRQGVDAGLPRLFVDSVTVKQFRDPESPHTACYKALVHSPMGVERLNQAGLLGDGALLRGDVSGGYNVRIHRYAAQPIIETLGIETHGPELQTESGSVAVLRPTLPFWADLDLYYGRGEVICERRKAGAGGSRGWSVRRPAASTQAVPSAAGTPTPAPPDAIAYNTAQGVASQPVVGPFFFPDVTVQVFPLLADPEQLDAFVQQYLNEPLGTTDMRFRRFGSYVYLMVTANGGAHGAMWSENQDVGCWAEHEVTFGIPVKWYDPQSKLVSVAMIEPFAYLDSRRAVATDREVNGRASVIAAIDSPRDAWLSQGGPVAPRSLLHVETEALPAFGLGQKAEYRTLLDIDETEGLAADDAAAHRMVASSWGRRLVGDLRRKGFLAALQMGPKRVAKSLALEILARDAPVHRLTLKQYRDAEDVGAACYQAAVLTPRTLARIYDIREIERPVHVHLHRVPGHPIAQVLGLSVKSVRSVEGQVVETLQPIRPFWMRVAVREGLGEIVGTVTAVDTEGRRRWELSHPWFARHAAAEGSDPRVPYFLVEGDRCLGRAEHVIKAPRGIKDQANTWLRRSLTNELALIRVGLEALPPSETIELLCQLGLFASGSRRAAPGVALARLLAAESAGDFCAAAPMESLADLTLRIRQRLPTIVEPDAWTKARQVRAVETLMGALEGVPQEERDALAARLATSEAEALGRLCEHLEGAEQAREEWRQRMGRQLVAALAEGQTGEPPRPRPSPPPGTDPILGPLMDALKEIRQTDPTRPEDLKALFSALFLREWQGGVFDKRRVQPWQTWIGSGPLDPALGPYAQVTDLDFAKAFGCLLLASDLTARAKAFVEGIDDASASERHAALAQLLDGVREARPDLCHWIELPQVEASELPAGSQTDDSQDPGRLAGMFDRFGCWANPQSTDPAWSTPALSRAPGDGAVPLRQRLEDVARACHGIAEDFARLSGPDKRAALLVLPSDVQSRLRKLSDWCLEHGFVAHFEQSAKTMRELREIDPATYWAFMDTDGSAAEQAAQDPLDAWDALGRLVFDPVSELEALVAAVRPVVRDRTSEHESSWYRVMQSEAIQAIDTLEEVQLVIESILTSGWENRDPARTDSEAGSSRGSDHRIPVGSVLDPWIAHQGLVRWPDAQRGPWWVLPEHAAPSRKPLPPPPS